MDTDTLSPTEAAKRLGISRQTFTKWADDGAITEYRTPSGWRRYRIEDVDELARSLGIDPERQAS